MAPVRAHALATVLSAQVVTHDEKAILVEAGGFTPVRWFLERGHQIAESDASDQDEERPRKKRKTGVSNATSPVRPPTQSSADTIPLAQVTVDLHFPQTLVTKPPSKETVDTDVDFTESSDVPVIVYGIGDDHGGANLKLAHPMAHGAVLKLDLANIPKSTLNDLRTIAIPSAQKAAFDGTPHRDHPASITRCVLKRSMGDLYCIVRLEASLAWRDGVSAFPAGVPGRASRVYKDYDLKSYFFPDAAREAVDHTQRWTPQDFYNSVHVPEQDERCEFGRILDIDLYPFQQRAIKWMLGREGVEYRDGRVTSLPMDKARNASITLHEEARDAAGEACFVNHLQGILSREKPATDDYSVSGGLLAEEMGLGKTVELMALISLHKRPKTQSSKVYDAESETQVLPSRATLIVSPSSILPQWRSELGRHAPALKVMHYEGIPPATKKDSLEAKILQDLTENYDVVLTTYQVLAREIHYAEDPPARNMRYAPKFERKRSPLVQVQFWRTVMDEAQMIESGVTAAARVASRLPRVNSWAVTGTPLPKGNVQDLHGLLIFLRLKPFHNDARLWSHLVTNHRHIFQQIIAKIALRHTKAQIRDELRLPPQKRVVITVPFTAVEHQQYNGLFNEMCEDLAVDSDGSPLAGDWNPNDPGTVDKMRRWLVRLRQTCLHPEVGAQNRRALGRGQGPLRTVLEVLGVMIDQNETSTRAQERAALASQLLRAHILGNAGDDPRRSEKALAVYKAALETSVGLVEDARQRLNSAKAAGLGGGGVSSETEGEDSSNETAPILGGLRNNLRTALQLQHVCTFFAATACFQIKSNDAITEPDSDEYKDLEQQEVGFYEQAKVLRREILRDAARKSEALMHRMRNLVENGQLTEMPRIHDLKELGGIENRRIVDKSDELFDVIREQVAVIVEWRAKMASFLLKPLVDEDEDGNEITGDEYEDSTKQQDELYVYFDALKAMQADLNTFITGEAAPLIDHEAKYLIRAAHRTLDPEDIDELREPCHAPERLLELFGVRGKFRSRVEEVGSVRGLIHEARALENSMQWHDSNSRAGSEVAIVQRHLTALQSVFTAYTKALAGLEKEVDLFRSTQNQRLEFYRQLQELSDAVAPYKEELDDNLDLQALEIATAKAEDQNNILAQLKTKHRFLLHLRDESGTDSSNCVICQCSFDNGVLTVCGHTFCKICIQTWWKAHQTCPVCKRRLKLVDFHNITYRPSEMRAKEETNNNISSPSKDSNPNSSLPLQQSKIYSEVDSKLMDEIKMFDLPRSYGTKIDTLAKHMLWIREHDPGAKSIVFSQYRQFLDVLSAAFSEFKMGYSRLGRAGAVEKFRHDPSIDCLLLDAKTDSSGLTLVNATHVFICEPLIQTAVELQAIARVHRIGQTRQTTIWMYLVNDTVEESIYEISVARRMAHVQARQHHQRNEKARSTTPGPLGEMALEAADTEELQSAPLSKLLSSGTTGGEMVGKDDLWQCLFGRNPGSGAGKTDKETEQVFNRQLRALAAEHRKSGS